MMRDLVAPWAAGNPVFSVDMKPKEFLGGLFRKGRTWCSQANRVRHEV